MKPTLIRLSSLALALLMLLPATLTACKPAQVPDETTDNQDSVTESLPLDTETSEPDAFENTLLLAADGQTAYTVVVPDYAAAWELTAADRLVSTLADLGVTTTPAVDTATEATAREIVVGYTNRNGELAEDFYSVGIAGYHIAAIGEKLFIGANTEAGLTAADRGAFLMTNQTMTVVNDMATAGNRQVSTFVNEYGVPYLRDTMSAYVEAGGKRHYSKDSTTSSSMNIFLYGAYHYETHIRGQNFGNSRLVDASEEPVDMI